MRLSIAPVAAVVMSLLLVAACGGGGGAPSGPTTSAPTPAPTPVPTPTPPIDAFAIVSSEPANGGVIHTGTSPNGTSTAFKLTLSVASAADRVANIQVFLVGPRNGVCLENVAPDRRPTAPDVDLKAGVPATVTIETWRVTSVCGYPNNVTSLNARMMPSPDISGTPIFERTFAVQYTVTQ
jgi:hypothetical protein